MESYIKQGDCLELMKELPDRSIDMILCDLPYGVLNKGNANAKWDSVIPFNALWASYNHVIKDNGAIVLFGSGLFTADLMLSNRKMWRYNLIWKKGERVSGFLNANRMPLRNHEDIAVFYKKLPYFHPQMVKCEPHQRNHGRGNLAGRTNNNCYGSFIEVQSVISDEKFPKSVIDIQPEHKEFLHPSQKPVELLKWLIKSYTEPGEVVLDNCMGSGSTCVAAMDCGRKYVGFELEPKYFDIAKRRIEEAENSKNFLEKNF